MGVTINWDEVPDSTLLKPDMYELEVELEKQTSKAGNLMYKGTFRVAEGDFAGTPIFDYFTIGNADDRMGEKQETWNNAPGSKRLKRLFKALMITLSGDVDALIEKAQGQRCIGAVDQRVEGGEGQYANVKKNVITAFHPLGSRAVGTVKAPTPSVASTAPTMSCPWCSASIARAEYSKHVKSMHPDEA